MNMKIQLCIHSKDFYTTLFFQEYSLNKSDCGEVNSTRFECFIGVGDKTSRTPVEPNFTYGLTVRDGLLTQAFQMTF